MICCVSPSPLAFARFTVNQCFSAESSFAGRERLIHIYLYTQNCRRDAYIYTFVVAYSNAAGFRIGNRSGSSASPRSVMNDIRHSTQQAIDDLKERRSRKQTGWWLRGWSHFTCCRSLFISINRDLLAKMINRVALFFFVLIQFFFLYIF